MVQISGKYQLVKNVNFYEFLLAVGLPEPKAKEIDESKATTEISVDGDNIKITTDAPNSTTNLIIGKEVDEQTPRGDILKSTAKLDGNVITITSKSEKGPPGTKTMTFSDSSMELVITVSKDGKTYTATRTYKRI